MELQQLLDHLHELSDLELGVLLSLVAQGHCLMTIEDDLVDDLASELSLIVSERFGLSYAVLDQDDLESADKFSEAILEEQATQISTDDDYPQPGSLRARLPGLNIRAGPRSSRDDSDLDNRMIKNVIITKGFNIADESVQVQAIEIINNKRFLSHTRVHVAPKQFLFIPIISVSSQDTHLIPHLNDRIFISHHHLPEHGFANLEELDESVISGSSSKQSSRQPSSWDSQQKTRIITKDNIESIRAMGEQAAMTPEVRRYLQDIVTFLRLERGVDGGIMPRATTQFVALAKYLAPLHGISFVTPSLVALAARKIYPHRITIVEPLRERSMQYGSDLQTVVEMLDGLTPRDVIEAVLNTVQSPM